MSYGLSGQRKKIWIPTEPFPQIVIDHVNAGFPIEAHNCQFERAIWTHILHPQFFIPVPQRWLDTMAICAYKAVPQGLDGVGSVLDLPIQKNKRGKYLLGKLSKPQKPTKKNPETRCTDPALMQELYDYCIQDSEAEDVLGETLGDLTRSEFAIWVMDQRINKRGVLVDMDAVLGALKIVNLITERLEKELQQLTNGAVTTGSEVAKILKWCKANGADNMENLQAGTVEDFLKLSFIPDNVKRVLQIRQQLSRASAKKLIKFRDCANMDLRVRGLLQYHGAGTGRWAGRLVQPQNFPRGSIKDMDTLIATIKYGDPDLLELHFGDPMEAIASSLRGMFISSPGKTFYVADFAAIEARVVMWVAGQMDALEAFYEFDKGNGPDIYCVMAGKIYGRLIDKKKDPDERQLGKIGVLGCGYQMSGPKLQIQALDSYKTEISLETANRIVEIYRREYSCVVDLWRALEDAAIRAVRYKCYEEVVSPNGVTIGFQFITDKAGNWLAIVLPNGRRLWYYNPGLESREITYTDKKTGELKTFTKDQLHYEGRDNKKGGAWGIVYSYGGMLTENIVQAIARDLMVAAMIRAEKAGYEVVLTVHDEVVAEADIGRDRKEFETLVAGPNPPWAEGCPVAAEGWVGVRYRK